jgi:hypothetical protein
MKRISPIIAIFFLGACNLADPKKSNCDSCLDGGLESDTQPAVKPDAKQPDVFIASFIDNDKDGYDTQSDCDDNDPSVYPGAKEICDGKDNDCNGKIDDSPIDVGASCGSSTGECKSGTVECINAKLECDGATLVLPKNELCDGKDNNCNGKTDEDFPDLGKPCDIGEGECKRSGYFVCNGSATKLKCDAVQGSPIIEGPPGSPLCNDNLDNDCDGLIDGQDPDCKQCGFDSDCNDENPCTMDKCLNSSCQNKPLLDGAPCPNGSYCDGAEICQNGKCVSGQKVLCDDGNQCTSDICDETQKKCVFTAVSVNGKEGLPGNSACLDGQDNDCDGKIDLADPDCQGCNNDLECIKDVNICINYYCNGQHVCASSPKADGASCGDELKCNGLEVCQAGECKLGTPKLCNDNDACTTDKCDESLQGQCVYTSIQGCKSCTQNLQCDDGNPCTQDSCFGGKCYNTAMSDGASCDDGAFCTVNDKCSGGFCMGAFRDCSAFTDSCNTSICDEQMDVCKKLSKANGTACSNGIFCDGNETCQNGSCQAGAAPVCNDNNSCTNDECSPIQDKCVFNPKNLSGLESWAIFGSCSDGQDNDCDGKVDYADPDCRQCQYDTDCNGSPGVCKKNVCNTATYKCETINLTGTSCDDGQWCTIGDYCVNGYCQGGGQRNCNPGACNESTDTCDGNGNGPGCADGTREGFLDGATFPNIAGCSGAWSNPGLSNASYLCAYGWHIATGAADVAAHMPSGKTCWDAWSGSEKRFFATLQPSNGNGYCNTFGANDIFGCGNYGDPPQIGSCGMLNVFSSEDCSAIKYPYVGAPETWRCGGVGDSSDELNTVVKFQTIGGGIICCKN